jgi:hypothetical protein
MTSPLPLPDWVPWWVHLVLIVAILLFALLFLLMPFSVFGVKARLDTVEAQLDELLGEIRSLSLRLPDGGMDEDPYARPPVASPAQPPRYGQRRMEPRIIRPGRSEPRL